MIYKALADMPARSFDFNELQYFTHPVFAEYGEYSDTNWTKVRTISSYQNNSRYMREVTFPAHTTLIGKSTFVASADKIVTILAHTPPVLKNRAFYDTKILGIYVPDDSVGLYKNAAGWSAYSGVIYPLSEYQP